jgi:hypothetical protein
MLEDSRPMQQDVEVEIGASCSHLSSPPATPSIHYHEHLLSTGVLMVSGCVRGLFTTFVFPAICRQGDSFD